MKKKAVLLTGPPGIGKTSAAIIMCRELGYEPVEVSDLMCGCLLVCGQVSCVCQQNGRSSSSVCADDSSVRCGIERYKCATVAS